jgi:hypothetical protein
MDASTWVFATMLLHILKIAHVVALQHVVANGRKTGDCCFMPLRIARFYASTTAREG